ncbi:hypothetical protein Vi05172_g12497 [Venturia inaequalis]|nr:hypothetical protein Vi05172_g12497 [Venturia inaequalis]
MFINTSSIILALSALFVATNARLYCYTSQNDCSNHFHGRDCLNFPGQRTNGQSTPWCYYKE